MKQKEKVAKEDVQKKKTYVINQDSKRYKKGQEVELTDEMAEVFTNKGLIGNKTTPKEETEEQKEARLLKVKEAEEAIENAKALILEVLNGTELSKKDVVKESKLDAKITDKVMKAMVKDGVIVMSDKNEYSIKE